MQNIQQKCSDTTCHIANKILLLRRANKLTQEAFAERVNLDRRTIARAEDGKHRPSAETLELIATVFKVPISYFYDNSVYNKDIAKSALIYEIESKINVLPRSCLQKILRFIDIISC